MTGLTGGRVSMKDKEDCFRKEVSETISGISATAASKSWMRLLIPEPEWMPIWSFTSVFD